ncbi:MAG: type II toxin-antitoxin system RelE/ParE family toxin [Chroococcidiopsidaceae cyanobacterium CP_BM_RX_35]|nr:type II toxin-antitoxin system RelE/ParE family toxin [Chroococcidiopsidaceae cyanobacterium CP_BM_RX_35]
MDTCILKLAEEPYPRGCVKLEGSEDFWRVRVGNYRIIYQVEDDSLIVTTVEIGLRKNVNI